MRGSSNTSTPQPIPTGVAKGQYADRFEHVHTINLIDLTKLGPPAIPDSPPPGTRLQAAGPVKVGDEVIPGKAESVARAPEANVLQIGVRSSPVRPSLI
jgi:hypothetical protein